MVVKTFRGQLGEDEEDRIRLGTIKGKVGYRIIKFQVCLAEPGTTDAMQVFKIFKKSQSSFTATIDLTNSDLLAVAYIEDGVGNADNMAPVHLIFDQEIFNQDIFISHKNVAGTEKGNYYIELEVIRLTDSDAEFTTLKDIRGRNTTP